MTQTTRPYKQAEAIFIVIEKLGLDPLQNVRAQYALEQVLKASWNAALDAATETLGAKAVDALALNKLRKL